MNLLHRLKAVLVSLGYPEPVIDNGTLVMEFKLYGGAPEKLVAVEDSNVHGEAVKGGWGDWDDTKPPQFSTAVDADVLLALFRSRAKPPYGICECCGGTGELMYPQDVPTCPECLSYIKGAGLL